MEFFDLLILGDLAALKPFSYVIRLTLAVIAFGAAMQSDRVIGRVLGLVWLMITGVALLMVGAGNGTVLDILLGLAGICAAGYA